MTVLMCVQNNLVKMVNEFINRHMVSKGFYPSMPDSQACVLHVLGKENLPAAKQYLKELAIIEMVRCYVDWQQYYCAPILGWCLVLNVCSAHNTLRISVA